MPPKSARNRALNFDIDTYLNPLVPPSQLSRLPAPIAHFLGHRDYAPGEPPNVVSYLLAFAATITGLCVVGAVYNHAPGITQYAPPPLVASLGASAVLDYNTIRSPLSQPRNTVFGHSLSALVAVAVSKGFQRYDNFNSINWVASAVACATANLVMSITNTVHPPGGATAILACIQSDVVAMGFMYVPIIMLASVLMCAVACLFNNTLRCYPTHWWSNAEVGQAYKSKAEKQREEEDEKRKQEENDGAALEKQKTDHLSDIEGSKDSTEHAGDRDNEIRVCPDSLVLPSLYDFQLSNYERDFLGELQERLKMAAGHST